MTNGFKNYKRKGKVKGGSPPWMNKLARGVVLGQIMVCVGAVGWMLYANAYYNQAAMTERAVREMAREYYEDYFYERFLGGRSPSEEVFSDYVLKGFPAVSLREFLLYDDARNHDRAIDVYFCDKKASTVRFKPVAPFGREDYTTETVLECNYE